MTQIISAQKPCLLRFDLMRVILKAGNRMATPLARGLGRRYLFLEALLSARCKQLYISISGTSQKTNTAFKPYRFLQQ